MDVQPGNRLRLLNMPNDPCPIPSGSEGDVLAVTPLYDGTAQIVMKWDCGRNLNLIVPEDTFEVIERDASEAVH